MFQGVNLLRTLAALLVAVCLQAGAEDLFVNGALREIKPKALLQPSDTLGGYAIYPGEGQWMFLIGRKVGTTGPDTIDLAQASWIQFEGTDTFAWMTLTTNLNFGSTTRSWSGTPCGPNHFISRNKVRGRDDRCMTIDAVSQKLAGKDVTLLLVKITNTAAAGRYYVMDLYINPGLLGHIDTVVGDWTQEQVQLRPERKEFVERLTQWAEQLHDASITAYDFDKPQDAYKNVPSWRTLFPIAAGIIGGKFTQQFASALYDLRFRPGFKAMAYSNFGDGKTRWHRVWAMDNQADANARALRACDQDRLSSVPACRLYPLQ